MAASSAVLGFVMLALSLPSECPRSLLSDFLAPCSSESYYEEDGIFGPARIEVCRVGGFLVFRTVDPSKKGAILPPVPTLEDVVARTAEFIDAHPELFHVPSEDLRPFSASPLFSDVWRLSARQRYRGVWLYGTYFALDVYKDGRLWDMDARLFPAAYLEALDVVPRIDDEGAVAFAVDAYGVGTPSRGPEAVVFFRGLHPFPGWLVRMKYPYEPFRRGDIPSQSLYFGIDGNTGDILGIQNWVFDHEPFDIPVFIRGDANADGKLDLADPVHGLSYLFGDADRKACSDAHDANDDGRLDLADPIYELRFLFSRGVPPPKPFPRAGPDPTADDLDDHP